MEASPLFEYTLMPMHNRSLFTIEELEPATLERGFGFTRGAPVMRLPARADAKRSPRQGGFADTQTVLYDLQSDPHQMTPLDLPEIEADFCNRIVAEMTTHEAPAELYDRFDLSPA